MIQAINKSFQYSPRGQLVPGNKFRVTGGPVYRDKTRLGHRGLFVFQYAYQLGKRTYIEARQFDPHYGYGRSVTLFVQGRSYRRPATPGVMVRPYKIRKLKVQ